MNAADPLFVQATLELAELGRISCAPNPPVGCIIVRDGHIIGRGFHRKAGEGHAEVNAIADASGDVSGATVYVSLEPCSFVGRTPACANTLIEANVARVVVATLDPHPKVAGSGVAMLRAAGIPVDVLASEPAAAIIAGFRSRVVAGRPLVRLKSASSLDGAIALASGESQWITGPQARADVQRLRAYSDALVTGIGTVLADDPSLTVRAPSLLNQGAEQPLRVVLDSQLRTPIGSKVVNDGWPTWVVHQANPAIVQAHKQAQRDRGVDVELTALPGGTANLSELLSQLALRDCNEVLVEAGPKVLSSFLQQGLWDEWICYLAPRLLGDNIMHLTSFSLPSLAQALSAQIVDQQMIGADLRLTLKPISS